MRASRSAAIQYAPASSLRGDRHPRLAPVRESIAAGRLDWAGCAVLIQQYGLDQPLGAQYGRYLGHALAGNFGKSYQYRQPVISVIAEMAVLTLQLATAAILLTLCLAVANALATAGGRRGLRTVLSGFELALLSTPVYWISIVLLTLFSFRLHWFPVTGNDGFASLALPAIALSLPLAALLSQVRSARSECLDRLTKSILRRVRAEYIAYDDRWGPHQPPGQRPPCGAAPCLSQKVRRKIVAEPVRGGLHHVYKVVV